MSHKFGLVSYSRCELWQQLVGPVGAELSLCLQVALELVEEGGFDTLHFVGESLVSHEGW